MKVFIVVVTDANGDVHYGNKSGYFGSEKIATVYTKPAPARALRTRLSKLAKNCTIEVVEYELTQTSILDD